MSTSKPSFKVTMIYGLFVTVPIAVLVIILFKLIEILEKIAKATGLHSVFGASIAVLLALIALLVFCYIAGTLVQTQVGAWSFDKVEKKLLLQIPGYRIISSILKGAAEQKVETYRPVFVQLGQPGVSTMGFAMEENDNDTLTVFIPSVPAPTIGGLYIVEKSRVTFLEASHLEAVNCITEWGVGTNKLIGKKGP